MLENLRARYKRDAVYTYTAHILIACNPFKQLGIYAEDRMAAYAGKPLGVMEPHVFAVADRAYRSMSHYACARARAAARSVDGPRLPLAPVVGASREPRPASRTCLPAPCRSPVPAEVAHAPAATAGCSGPHRQPAGCTLYLLRQRRCT